MKKFRGLIALVISVVFGLVAAKAVHWYLKRPKPRATPVQAVAPKPRKPETLSQKIPDGMRLVSVQVDEASGMPKGIKKGDCVDVLASSTIPEKNGAAVTRVILRRVEIFDSGEESKASSKKISRAQRNRTVSLLVRPDQAAVLTAASESADIRLSARNPADESPGEIGATVYSYTSGVKNARQAVLRSGLNPKPGMRAITIKARDTDGVLGILNPGDRVDVIVTCPHSRFGTSGGLSPGTEGKVTEWHMNSRTLLQNVEVLATETLLDLGVGKEEPAKRVTLLVTPSEAEKLTVVSDAPKKGVIRLVSRHPEDFKHVVTPGRDLADVLAGKRIYHRVEIYRGGKLSSPKHFFQ